VSVSTSHTPGGASYLLPHLHDLEPLEIVQTPPLLHGRTLLGPCAVVELLVYLRLLPLLSDVADTGRAGQLGDDDGEEGELCERNLLSGNGRLLGGTIDEHLSM
jgi:hypothetical protein